MDFCGEWTASHDRMPGKPETLRVDGCVCFDDGSWTAELVEHDGPQGINPKILIIDLVVSRSDVGADVLSEVPVHYELQTSSEYDQVQVDPRDEPGSSKLVDVQEVSRAD